MRPVLPSRHPTLAGSLALALARAGRMARPRARPRNPYALRDLLPTRAPRPALRAARRAA